MNLPILPSKMSHGLHPRVVRRSAHGMRGGFSLIELLVVIGIIAIIGAAVGMGLRDSSGSALRSAVNIIAAQVQAARTTAILGNTEVRLLIENSQDEENAFRRMRLVRKDAGSDKWEVASPPVRLPKGVFIVVNSVAPHSTRDSSALLPLSMTFDGKDYYYYEFSSTGTLERNAGARIVVAAGRFEPGVGWKKKNETLVQGLFLRRLGDSSIYDDPEHLKASFSP